MRFTSLLAIAALISTCFVAGAAASETGTFIQSGDAAHRVVAAADPMVARELPLQALLPPSRAGEAPAFPAEAPSKSDAHPLRIAIPPQGPPA